MNAELPMVGAGLVSMGGAALMAVALTSLLRPSGAHRALPRGQRVPAAIAPESEYAGFHDGPLSVGPTTVAADWGHCLECTARRYGQVLTDSSFLCPDGHLTIAEGDH